LEFNSKDGGNAANRNFKAQKLLKKLEKDHSSDALNGIKSEKEEMQMSFFNLDDPLLEEIKDEILNLDINTITPMEALMKLNEIKRMLTGNNFFKV
jgi:DNA mismatch repair protein MutS